jgi:hypothetical protein
MGLSLVNGAFDELQPNPAYPKETAQHGGRTVCFVIHGQIMADHMPETGRPYPTLGLGHLSVSGHEQRNYLSSPRATGRASRLRVRTRVTTVTRL